MSTQNHPNELPHQENPEPAAPEPPNTDEVVLAVTILSDKFRQIGRVTDTTQRREQREDFAAACIGLGVKISALGKWALYQNIQDGAWQTARDGQGNAYANSLAYFLDFWQSNVEAISASSAYADFEKFRIMSQLGLSDETQQELLAKVPTLTGNFLQRTLDVSPSGEVLGIADGYRPRMEEVLGVTPEESAGMTDQQVFTDFMEHLADAGAKSDIGSMAQSILKQWTYRIEYLAKEGVLQISGYQKGDPKGFVTQWKPLQSQANRHAMAHPEAVRVFLRRLNLRRIVRL